MKNDKQVKQNFNESVPQPRPIDVNEITNIMEALHHKIIDLKDIVSTLNSRLDYILASEEVIDCEYEPTTDTAMGGQLASTLTEINHVNIRLKMMIDRVRL